MAKWNTRHVMKAALVFALCVFAAIIGFRSALAAEPPEPPSIAFVPLDNRPPCFDYAMRLAEIAGARAYAPPYSAIGAYSFEGDPTAVAAWIDSLEPPPDYLIVSSDMLAYGGLVASRKFDADSPDRMETAIDALKRFAARAPESKIFAFGTIQRIARTATGRADYDSVTSQMAQFLKLADEAEFTGNALLKASAKSLRALIPDEQLRVYASARKRNHETNLRLVELAAAGDIDFLAIGMDDNATFGPHRRERVELEQAAGDAGARDAVYIKPGADELAHLLIARAANDWRGAQPRVSVAYFPPETAAWTPPLEDRPLAESVALSLRAAGAELADADASADSFLLAYGGAGGEEAAFALAAEAARLVAEGKKTGVADLRYVNKSDPAIVEALAAALPLRALSAYSGWNTAGNALGTAIAHLLVAPTPINGDCLAACASSQRRDAHINFLLQRFLDEYVYMALVRPGVEAALADTGHNPFNIPGDYYPAFRAMLKKKMAEKSETFFESRFKSGARGGELLRLDILVPWFRTFEIEIDARTVSPDAP